MSTKEGIIRQSYAVPTESEEQIALFEWAEAMSGQYPDLQLMHHIPNGGKRNIQTAARMKREGVKAGIPDIFLPVARSGYHGLYVELKRVKGGRVSDEQRDVMGTLQCNGYCVKVARGANEAIEIIMDYIKN